MSDMVLKSEISPPSDRVFLDAIAYGKQAPFPPQYSEYVQAMVKLDDAWLGLKSVDEVCRRFAKDVDEAITGEVW